MRFETNNSIFLKRRKSEYLGTLNFYFFLNKKIHEPVYNLFYFSKKKNVFDNNMLVKN